MFVFQVMDWHVWETEYMLIVCKIRQEINIQTLVETESECTKNTTLNKCTDWWKQVLKISNETQASHIFFFTLLVMLGNYQPTCIVTLWSLHSVGVWGLKKMFLSIVKY